MCSCNYQSTPSLFQMSLLFPLSLTDGGKRFRVRFLFSPSFLEISGGSRKWGQNQASLIELFSFLAQVWASVCPLSQTPFSQSSKAVISQQGYWLVTETYAHVNKYGKDTRAHFFFFLFFELTIQVLDDNVKLKREWGSGGTVHLSMAFWFTGLLFTQMSVWLDYLPTCVCMCVCVCMRDTANISMINTQHTTLPVKDSTVYFSWTQNKAHGHYLQLCTVCVCVCLCACLCVSVSGAVEQWEQRGCLHWTAVDRCKLGGRNCGFCGPCIVVMRAEPSQQWWIKQLGRVCVHKEEKQKHWSSTMCSSTFSVMLVLCRKEVEVEL